MPRACPCSAVPGGEDRAGEAPRWWVFVLTGFCASFAACNELPAAAFASGLGLLLLWRYPRPTLLGFVPAALVPVAALLLTNYLAVGGLLPVQAKFGSAWYLYEGSHWAKQPDPVKPGIDFARLKESRGTYAFHVLLGHHGLFSLTPIYLLALVGMVWGVRRLASRGRQPPDEVRGIRAETLTGALPGSPVGDHGDRDAGADRGRGRLLSRQDGQLRRLDQWPALADVADAVLAAQPAARRRPTRCLEGRTWVGLPAAGAVGTIGELLPLESLAASVALQLHGGTRLDSVLTVSVERRFAEALPPNASAKRR